MSSQTLALSMFCVACSYFSYHLSLNDLSKADALKAAVYMMNMFHTHMMCNAAVALDYTGFRRHSGYTVSVCTVTVC